MVSADETQIDYRLAKRLSDLRSGRGWSLDALTNAAA